MSEEIKIIELKELDNALDLLMDFNREIKIYKTEEEMKQTSEKFLKLGNPIGIVQEGKLIAYFNLYCNNYETLEAYFGNLYVLKSIENRAWLKSLFTILLILQRKRDLKRLCSMLPRIMSLQLSFMKVAVLNIPAKAK